MNDPGALAEAGEGGLELKKAAGIAGGDDVGVEWRNELGLAVAQGVGGIGLDEVVDSRGAAADGGLGNFRELQLGNVRKQGARLGPDTLGMLQMAGIVEGDAEFQWMSRGAWLEIGEDFADVLALRGKLSCALRIFRIVTQEVPILLYV